MSDLPGCAEEYAYHYKAILDGDRPPPAEMVLIEFYPDQPAACYTHGLGERACSRARLAQICAAIEILSRAARSLNGQAAV